MITSFEPFFKQYPDIKAVFFNGKKAGEFFTKLVIGNKSLNEGLLFYTLPSTSPANQYDSKINSTSGKLFYHF